MYRDYGDKLVNKTHINDVFDTSTINYAPPKHRNIRDVLQLDNQINDSL